MQASAHRPLPGRGRRIWTRAGRAGCWRISASRTPRCAMRTCRRANLQAEIRRDRVRGSAGGEHRKRQYGAPDAGGVCGRAGRAGARDALREFATSGGTLVFLNGASDYAISRLGIAAKNVTRGGGPQRILLAGVAAERQAGHKQSAGVRRAGGTGDLERAQSGVGHATAGGGALSRVAACWPRAGWWARRRSRGGRRCWMLHSARGM